MCNQIRMNMLASLKGVYIRDGQYSLEKIKCINGTVPISKQYLAFTALKKKAFEKENGKMRYDGNQHFLLFPQYVLPYLKSFFMPLNSQNNPNSFSKKKEKKTRSN